MNQIMIVSAFKNSNDDYTNLSNHIQTMDVLKDTGIPFIEIEGLYKNHSELSILVPSLEYKKVVEKIAKTFEQECYLENLGVDAYLIYVDGTKQYIGTFQAISKEETEITDSYSYVPGVGYFSCKQ